MNCKCVLMELCVNKNTEIKQESNLKKKKKKQIHSVLTIIIPAALFV